MAEIKDKQLTEIRKEIDIMDNQILALMEQRFELVGQVAERKRNAGLPIRDIEREKEVIESKLGKSDLPEDFVRKLYRLIIDTAAKMEGEK